MQTKWIHNFKESYEFDFFKTKILIQFGFVVYITTFLYEYFYSFILFVPKKISLLWISQLFEESIARQAGMPLRL